MTDTLKLGNPNVKVVAHRGCSGLELENTNSAFVAAGNRSYYGIETDVHRTADGQLIIFHDDNTKRVALDEMVVEKTCFETLRAVTLADRDGRKGRRDLIMPTLAEYAGICRKYGKVSVLELKNHFKPEDIDRIIGVMREADQLEHTVFISFDLPNMICLRGKLPKQPAQFLISEWTDWLVDTLVKYHLDLDIYYKALTEERIKELHGAGIEVNAWTVNELEDAQRLASWGIDYITSNIVE